MKKILAILVLLVSLVSAIEVPPIPTNSFVYDGAGIMSANQVYQLNSIASDLAKNARFGLAVATFKTIDGEDPVQFSLRVAQKWAICSKDSNEGVFIYVVMDPHYRGVHVGYGSEGYLPDVLVEHMQQTSLIPALQSGEGGQGIIKLASMIATKVQEEKKITLTATLDTAQLAPADEKKVSGTTVAIVVAIVIVVLILLAIIEALTDIPVFSTVLVILSCLGGGKGGGGSSGFGGGGFGGGGSHGGW